MSIVNRVLLGFAALILLTGMLGLFAIRQMGDVRASTETILRRDLSVLRQVQQARDNQYRMRETRSSTVLRALGGDASGTAIGIAAWQGHSGRTEASLVALATTAQQLEGEALSPERRQAWRESAQIASRALSVYRRIAEQTAVQFEAMRSGSAAAAIAAADPLAQLNTEFDQLMEQLDAALDRLLRSGDARIEELYADSRLSVVVLLGVALLVAILLALLLRQSINRPLQAFTAFLERVGRGDLSGKAEITGGSEIARLAATLNSMVDGLRQIALQGREATENLNAAAAEIRASTQEQAASVEEQLAAVQETAATVDEITHSGTQIGKRAQEVIASAQATAQTSAAGVRAVDDTVQAMDSIREQAEAVASNIVALSEKTQAIGDIISTVNDISERSHLLALNAALEAAAAGEHGRSFAVVAAEMKTLADQAKEATGQVRSILGDIQRGINASVLLTEEAVKRVGAGKERTDTTRATITEITSRVQESVLTFQQIVASTNQQQLGIEQVMAALHNIRQASEQTAASTRQLDQAAGNLAGLSQQLVTLTERYRL